MYILLWLWVEINWSMEDQDGARWRPVVWGLCQESTMSCRSYCTMWFPMRTNGNKHLHLPWSVVGCNSKWTQQHVDAVFWNNVCHVRCWHDHHKVTQAVPATKGMSSTRKCVFTWHQVLPDDWNSCTGAPMKSKMYQSWHVTISH